MSNTDLPRQATHQHSIVLLEAGCIRPAAELATSPPTVQDNNSLLRSVFKKVLFGNILHCLD